AQERQGWQRRQGEEPQAGDRDRPVGSPAQGQEGAEEEAAVIRSLCADLPLGCRYLGWTDWSPPGLPGGGITGILPAGGVGALMSGSTSGGHSTPSVRASLLLRFSPLPVVAAAPPLPGICCVWSNRSCGAQAFGSTRFCAHAAPMLHTRPTDAPTTVECQRRAASVVLRFVIRSPRPDNGWNPDRFLA